jgi:hypothetical protein
MSSYENVYQRGLEAFVQCYREFSLKIALVMQLWYICMHGRPVLAYTITVKLSSVFTSAVTDLPVLCCVLRPNSKIFNAMTQKSIVSTSATTISYRR